MAHFAQIEDGLVTNVIVIANEILLDSQGVEIEQQGLDFCSTLLGGVWVQTSYNGNFRKNYAGKGFSYDSVRDAFIPYKPYPSWVLDESTCRWEAPIPEPESDWDTSYYWDEPTITWALLETPLIT